jgi:hypothetical protein
MPLHCYLRPCEKRQYNAHLVSSPEQVFATKSGQPFPQGDADFTVSFGCFLDFVAIGQPEFYLIHILNKF